jgi:glycosyltransferase involved in cell wall biosynthesis
VRGLRFCFITTFYPPHNFGGDGIAVQRLARALVERGHQVTVIHDVDAFAAMNPGRVRTVSARSGDGVEVVELRSGLGRLAPLITHQLGSPLANRRRIREVLDRGDFDVITYNNISLVGGPEILSYGSALKLYMAHEYWLVCPMHVLWRDNREPCTSKHCLRCTLVHRRPPQLYRWTGLIERNLKYVDTFIAPSEFSRRQHHEFGFSREMEVLPYFLPDPEPDAVDIARRPHQRPYFLFAGRLEEIKGAQDLIGAFRGYADADLLIAGTGSYRPELDRCVNSDPRIKFLGHVDERDLRRYYRHALAVVVPSLCFETFCLVLIEAFRESTPIIARRRGPFPEVIEQSNGGELFSDNTELLAAMRRLQGDVEYRNRLGRQGHRAYLERWCASVVVPGFLEIVRQSAERRKWQDTSGPPDAPDLGDRVLLREASNRRG